MGKLKIRARYVVTDGDLEVAGSILGLLQIIEKTHPGYKKEFTIANFQINCSNGIGTPEPMSYKDFHNIVIRLMTAELYDSETGRHEALFPATLVDIPAKGACFIFFEKEIKVTTNKDEEETPFVFID